MENGKDRGNRPDRILELYKLGEMKSFQYKDKEEKFLKHISEINKEREKLKGKNKWKIPKLFITLVVLSIGIFIMFLPEKSLIGKSIFAFNPPKTLKLDIGKYTVMYFFSSHCDVCVEGIAELVSIQNENGNRVTVVGVAVEEPQEKLDELVRTYGVNYQVLVDREGDFTRNLGIDALPTTLIISDDSKIRGVIYGPISSERIMGELEKIDRRLRSAVEHQKSNE